MRAVLPGSWPKLETRPDVRLGAGDEVGSLEVVPTPGHTPGHVAFQDTRDGTMIAGDTFTARPARGRQPLLPAVPIRRDGQLGQDAGARVGSSSAFTRSDTPRRRARPRASRPRLGDGSGDQPSPRLPVESRCAGARLKVRAPHRARSMEGGRGPVRPRSRSLCARASGSPGCCALPSWAMSAGKASPALASASSRTRRSTEGTQMR
jgi:Metallo-beta-lactamase superfamily